MSTANLMILLNVRILEILVNLVTSVNLEFGNFLDFGKLVNPSKSVDFW